MFRKPRDSTNALAEQLGRPPSPSAAGISAVSPPKAAPQPPSSRQASTTDMSARATKLPLAGGNATRRVQAPQKIKSKTGSSSKPNGSILSFFKKVDAPPTINCTNSKDIVGDNDDDLFVGDADDNLREESPAPVQMPTPPTDDMASCMIELTSRFNENGGSVKRRKTGMQLLGRSLDLQRSVSDSSEQEVKNIRSHLEVEDHLPTEDVDEITPVSEKEENVNNLDVIKTEDEADETLLGSSIPAAQEQDPLATPPSLLRHSTSAVFEDVGEEDFINEDLLEELGEFGEEFLERKYAEEQSRLEDEANDLEGPPDENAVDLNGERRANSHESSTLDSDAPPCPVCDIALAGITAEQASTHVNNCLDGRPTPLPKASIRPPGVKVEPGLPTKRFMKASIARPGQDNPFSLGGDPTSPGGSAFSKLMSGHAEDTAWATAAANEVASRGKPAFKRTCPFYKILSGFFICVDAFRYGAVQNCSAYFLSHFHSDHYIGLTSSWCHGPIYCSKVTANLVKQQLRVDPKYVVALEFENKIEVPGTRGVFVTMIPANHCPGSSLYLFEKTIGKGDRPKVQRVLHCGDFRACPAHVHHPLLRPDVIDAVSGKCREQKLDVCYLDTTYLTPKYAFPLQHEVVQACADMCVSLSKEQSDENDDWERVKRERAGAGMVRFIRSNSSGTYEPKKELDEDGNVIAVGKDGNTKKRGRLLVIVGTYSIGKERICLGIAKALNSKIYATAGKQRICAALEDPELTSRLTSNPLEAQVHMQMIMEIRAETLAEYLASYKPHFSRIVGFRPSGWNYRPPNSRFTDSPLVQTVLHSDNWKSKYTMHELMPQRGSTREASCYGVPYSEHSSFRELTMFCCALRIDKIIPTVNIGSAKSRERMKGWFEKWEQEKKKNGLYKAPEGTFVW